ncbi:nucleolar protein 10 (nucleomorph) [Chroomonas mesostigmatica CCMP1168]|uniref:Nucleolar protein 10 n=1 Tax=Chroomonas mesostigmatica CCMP1168 TaxID=1195612 RepID=J7G254_9CRYP|nr:nucleolar protein 10 [Chroomonas mesostigmatica CCMP1168]|mmetsp:Transcript_65899/g.162217  ORF Transcript_65899/g.162217 Transcript_65899/m.162217 type:complete len:346 (+) Transcript_65899:1626-2663(+)
MIKKKVVKKNSMEKNVKNKLNFWFPSSVKLIKETGDSNFLIGYGLYPPQLRCFDLNDLSLKFERHLDAEIVDFQILSLNWEKIVFLRADKYLEFQIKSGRFFQTKIPEIGIDLLFASENATIYIPSCKTHIFRYNLENGKFLNCLKNISRYHNTCSGKNPTNHLLIFGDTGGSVKLWDPRITKKFISKIKAFSFCKKIYRNPVSSLRFDINNPHQCYVGFKSGELVLFDLRTFKPLITKNMGNNLPIKSIRPTLHNNKVVTSDSKTIKIWNKTTGITSNFYETKENINHVCKIKKAGFIFVANDAPYIKGRYIENLGNFPDWCPNLKNEYKQKYQKNHKTIKRPF